MGVKYAARWRPSPYRSTIETIIVPGNPDATPPVSAARVQTLQLCVYDDTQVSTAGNPYHAGDPKSEQYLAVVAEVPIQLAISAFAGKTYQQSQALWDAARDQQIAAWQADPQILAYVNAAVGGYLSPLVVIG